MWFYAPQKWYEVPGFLWRAWASARAEERRARASATETPPRVTTTAEPARPRAVSADWVLNQLAGHRFPGQGEAYDYMKRCIKNALPEE